VTEFVTNLSSLYWWVSVVVVGILVNVCSTYLQKLLDSRMSRISDRWKKRSLERKVLYDWKVAELKRNVNYRFAILANMIVYSLISLVSFVIAIAVLIIASGNDAFHKPISDLQTGENIRFGLYFMISGLSVFQSFLFLKRIVDNARLINDAVDRTEESSNSDPPL
jgi:hypothetical protein